MSVSIARLGARDYRFLPRALQNGSFRPLFYPRTGIPSASYCFTRGQSSSILWQKGTSERVEKGEDIFAFQQRENVLDHLKYSFPFFPLPIRIFFSPSSLATSSFHPPVQSSAQTPPLPPRNHLRFYHSLTSHNARASISLMTCHLTGNNLN